MTETAAPTTQHSQELIDLLTEFYRAVRTSDMAALDRLLSQSESTLVIGTDPKEWWSGYEAILRVFAAQAKEMGGMPMTMGKPVAYAEGTMGWIADRPTLALPDGEIEARVSFVTHQEAGQWKVIHGHFSIGIPNEEAVGQDLTV